MAAAEGSRKVLCACGKPLAVFDAKGLNLYCRFSKETTTVPYGIAGLPEAIAFVNRLAPEAEAADHHPDILINYKRVTLTYSTHSDGGLTDKDFAGAAAADRLA